MPFLLSEVEQSIPHRFAAQVVLNPDKTAVISNGDRISYRELDVQSNQIANALLENGCRKTDAIALLLDQGVESVISILGILKAGKVYVSLSPIAGPDSIAKIIEHSGARTVIVQSDYAELIAALSEEQSLRVLLAGFHRKEEKTAPEINISPNDPAYIFYTSGTTGERKGVFDCHRNVLHNVMRYTNNLHIDASDCLSMIQMPHFSGTVSSLFSALLNGATLCPIDFAKIGASAMAREIVDCNVSIFHSVPSIFTALCQTRSDFDCIRTVRLEGDRVDARHIRLFDQRFTSPSCLAIGLGATETGLSVQWLHTPGDSVPQLGAPIGYPTSGMVARVQDGAGNDVPDDTPGELVITSEFLALGYWRDRKLTARKFRTCGDNARSRAYRTGDIVSRSAIGFISYVGRTEFQLRVRGVNIDATAVENALCAHPDIEHALVQLCVNAVNVDQLCAFIVTAVPDTLTITTVRQFLMGKLSREMIPARFVYVNALPLDQHGKIDRTALPALTRQRPPLAYAPEPPQDEMQQRLIECCEFVLGIDNIGIDDSFYDLGGDSLLVLQFQMRVEERTGSRFPEVAFEQSPTVRSVADALVRTPSEASIVPIGGGDPKNPRLFCLHNHYGQVMQYSKLSSELSSRFYLLGIVAADAAPVTAPVSVESLARAYLPLVLAEQATGPYWLCGNCFAGLIALELARLLKENGHEIAFLGLVDTAYPLGTWFARYTRLRRAASPWVFFTAILKRWGRRIGLVKESEFKQSDIDTNHPERLLDHSEKSNLNRSTAGKRIFRSLFDAQLAYRPQVYFGDATLFYTGFIGNCHGWEQVVKGRFEKVRLENCSDSASPHFIDYPMVNQLAAELLARHKQSS